MHARWLIAPAAAAILALPVQSAAQARIRVGVNSGAPAHPAAPSRPATSRPFRTTGIVPPFSGAFAHRPMLFRSSVLGLFVFDPYWWMDPELTGNNVAPPIAVAPADAMPTGGLQLDVEPRRALVYVDGVLAGTVDQFKGYFQHLETTAGFHVVTFITPDYDPLTVGVTVVPEKTTTYRGFLNRSR
jgi:hypothetical protein